MKVVNLIGFRWLTIFRLAEASSGAASLKIAQLGLDEYMAEEKNKDLILQALKEKKWVSGQDLAQTAGISRTGVWKHIKSLQKQGYRISSVSGRGYLLEALTDALLPGEIREGLETRLIGSGIEHFQELDSTQERAKKLAYEGIPEGFTVIAEKQSKGKGRLHRRWESLPGSLEVSVVLRPEISPFQASQISILAGVSAAESIRKSTGVKAELKWPNDVLVNRKKAGGILAELSAETERINFICLGIGLNVNCSAEDIPIEIREHTTSLKIEAGREVSRIRLVQFLLKALEDLYTDYNKHGFRAVKKRWRDLDVTLGSRVTIDHLNGPEEGTAEDIDDQGALIVTAKNGRMLTVNAGDVSIRAFRDR